MTTSPIFDKLPVSEFRNINEAKSKNVPEECPQDSPIDLNIRSGPILKLFNCNDKGSSRYLASLLLVLEDYDEVPSITYQLGDSNSQEVVGKGNFDGNCFYKHENLQFYRYMIDLPLQPHESVCSYAINGQTTAYWKFYLPASTQSMNIVSFSCNGFSLACDAAQYPSSLWFDVLNRHSQNPYHVMLGGGDQIYCDSVKVMSTKMQQWTQIDGFKKKQQMQVDEAFEQDLHNYYLHHYMAWFGKGFWVGKKSRYLDSLFPMAMATIPSINIFDDHDIIDGFGSYPEATMASPVFKAIGEIAFLYYMIFQHHQLPQERLQPQFDSSWIVGTTKPRYVPYLNRSLFTRLGPEIAVVGLDCRTERSLSKIVSDSSYKGIFGRMKSELESNPDIKHLLVMLGVPILYPRLVWLEMVLTSPWLKPLRKLAEMGVINKGLLNEFDGSIEVLDDINDHWCSKNHKAERNRLVRDLMEFGAQHSVRITILSGDVHLCCIGRLKSRVHHHPTFHPIKKDNFKQQNRNTLEFPQYDPRLMFNVTSSAIINAPPPDAMATLLDKRSKVHHFNRDCDEDVVPLFNVNPDGHPRANLQFLNKRNWCDLNLAKHSVHKNEVSHEDDERIVSRYPGSTKVAPAPSSSHNSYERFIEYPLLADSLVTTIHVEDDAKDFDCKTMGYELLIPPLMGSYELEDVVIKHVNESSD
ncbi:hypothetical protein PSN45_002542 [Yamadazyma tenuis]|uniref:PhoD-like phosphatase domain-containing protein n=1 Tax=Candida tenuis (strain ATCC 10573 / BCRC 21748 / CBS 615 / JCM 9827 / NBRC 10315 / NRRL Y-1498 / VKM Y-70) TaxID=590646 RepID=G3B039_CANTC|nr:uncharacterized protein CANTEDRAFT_119535 [Yamadazyma tenuis ATCC 10573]EGV65308.1 hypothetical protein CANTEDRAFT_119535 [Yamadazyma tenuis ATCC 10573]WEJ95033.1 hypothetical protein PSN45_002542 [Yamadazyma tenuis]